MTYTHQVKLDCAEQVIHQNKFVFTLMENGCYTIIAKDTAGNESTAPVTVTIDTPPKPMSSPLAPTEACRFHRHKRWRSAKKPVVACLYQPGVCILSNKALFAARAEIGFLQNSERSAYSFSRGKRRQGSDRSE